MIKINEWPNEDLVLTLETTQGAMRVYPVDGLWTVESIDRDTTGQPVIVIMGVELFSDAIRMILGSLYNAVAILDSELTMKDRATSGFVTDTMDEYRAKAVAKAEGV